MNRDRGIYECFDFILPHFSLSLSLFLSVCCVSVYSPLFLPPSPTNIPATGDSLYCFISIISPLFPILASLLPGPVKTSSASERLLRPRLRPRS